MSDESDIETVEAEISSVDAFLVEIGDFPIESDYFCPYVDLQAIGKNRDLRIYNEFFQGNGVTRLAKHFRERSLSKLKGNRVTLTGFMFEDIFVACGATSEEVVLIPHADNYEKMRAKIKDDASFLRSLY